MPQLLIQELRETSWNLGSPKCKSRQTSQSVCMQFAEMKLNQLVLKYVNHNISGQKINGRGAKNRFSHEKIVAYMPMKWSTQIKEK